MAIYRLKGARTNPAAVFNVRLPRGRAPDEELTTHKVAEVLGISGAVVRNLIRDGKLEGQPDPETGRWRVQVGELQQILAIAWNVLGLVSVTAFGIQVFASGATGNIAQTIANTADLTQKGTKTLADNDWLAPLLVAGAAVIAVDLLRR